MTSPPGSTNKPAAVSGRLLNFAPGSYLESTSRPLYALLFLLPWIIVYEIGTLWVNTEQYGQTLTRKCVVSFIWLTRLAQWVGIHPRLVWLFPGFVAVVILLCWHLVGGQPWRARLKWLGGMAVESVLLAAPLLILSAAIGGSARIAAFAEYPPPAPSQSYFAHLVTGIGAGIYEELVFRLILIGLMLLILEDLFKVKASWAALIAVAISSLLFALHHYIGIEEGRLVGFSGVSFTWTSFIFRTVAGVYFAFLFRYRGYGITAGCHGAYDILLKALWP